MKRQQIEGCGHGMAFSNRMRGTEMFSKYVWSLYIKKQHIEGVTKKVLTPQRNALRADMNKVCLGFVHMKILQKEEEQSVANKQHG